jgi:hypothetical protein
MNPQFEAVAKKIFEPCLHVDENGESALWPIGREEDHLEICAICSKTISSNHPEETDRDLV